MATARRRSSSTGRKTAARKTTASRKRSTGTRRSTARSTGTRKRTAAKRTTRYLTQMNDARTRVVCRVRYLFAICGKFPREVAQRTHERGCIAAEHPRAYDTESALTRAWTTAMEAARLMRDEDAGNIPVVDGERFVCTAQTRHGTLGKKVVEDISSRRNGLSAE